MTPRRAFPRLPDLRVIESPGWLQIVTPSITTSNLNRVFYSEHADDEVIDRTIAEYRALGVKFRWNVGPDCGPADLADRLASRGLEISWGRGVARTTEGAETADNVALVDASSLADFIHVMAVGWDTDEATVEAMYAHVLAEATQRLFVAYVDGVPAAAARYFAFERSAYLMGGVVLPAFRGRGLYRALVLARLAHARSIGIELATSHARERTSAPILERMGFETVCRFPVMFG